jgi:hypothetical protein
MTRLPLLLLLALALAGPLGLGSCDPVHAEAQAALGGETPGVPRGPLHRPGQPCLVCHDGAAGDPGAFSVAGTVYVDAEGTIALAGAAVALEGADGATFTSVTNAAGNFYVTPGEFTPRYPFHVISVTVGDVAVAMHSHIGGNGSCAGCHFDPPGPASPGHVYFNVPSGMTP